MPYHVYQPQIRPPWQAGPVGEAWHATSGSLKDGFAEGARQAVYAHYVSTAPDDALPFHGRDAGWPQAPGETTTAYRERLKLTRHLARWQGTRKGIVDAFDAIGLTNVEVKESFSPLWGRHKSGGVVEASKRYWINVIVRHPHPFGTTAGFVYGDGTTYGSGKQYGLSGDSRLLELLRMLVRKQKGKHSHCEWIAVVLDGDVIDGTDTTSDGAPLGGAASKVAYLVGI